MNFDVVTKALETGASPELLCATCPWDRNCITPPSMTSADVKAKLDEAKKEDERRLAQAKEQGEQPGMPVGSLLAILAHGGADTKATLCPVFALRLRSSGGRVLVDQLKSSMQTWDDDA